MAAIVLEPKLSDLAPAPTNAPIGRPGLKIWSGSISEEFQRELSGARAVRIFDEMRRSEPVVGSMMVAFTSIMQQSSLDIHAGMPGAKSAPESTDVLDLAAKELLQQAFARLDLAATFESICTMFTFGWAILEPVYKYEDGRIWWDRWALRGQDTLYAWDWDDENGQMTAFIQRPAPSYKEIRIPRQRFLLFRTSTEKDNPEGISILRPAYKPFYYKRAMEEVEALGAERDLVGIPVMEVPQNATDEEVARAYEIVERINVDEQVGIVLTATGPGEAERFKLSLLNGQGSSSKIHALERAIERYGNEITMTSMAQFLRLGQGGNGGSYNLSTEQRDLFQMTMAGWLQRICHIINKEAIPHLLALNGMLGHAHCVPGPVGSMNLQIMANFLTSGVQNGWLSADMTLEKFMRNAAGLPPAEPKPKAPAPIAPLPVAPVEGAAPSDEMPPEMKAALAEVAAEEKDAKKDNSGINANPGDNQSGTQDGQIKGGEALKASEQFANPYRGTGGRFTFGAPATSKVIIDEALRMHESIHNHGRYGELETNPAVAGVSFADDQAAAEEALKTVFEDASVFMSVPPQVLSGVLKTGEFKNYFDTGKSQSIKLSKTEKYRDARTKLEEEFFGADHHPTYGYVANNPSSVWKQYGDINIQFKPGVKKLSTWTEDDSLDTGRLFAVQSKTGLGLRLSAPSSISDPKVHSLSGIKHKDLRNSIAQTKDIDRSPPEAQIHARLDVGDIAHVHFPSGGTTAALTKALDKRGIPWSES